MKPLYNIDFKAGMVFKSDNFKYMPQMEILSISGEWMMVKLSNQEQPTCYTKKGFQYTMIDQFDFLPVINKITHTAAGFKVTGFKKLDIPIERQPHLAPLIYEGTVHTKDGKQQVQWDAIGRPLNWQATDYYLNYP
jgi:hypothetical protein